MRWILTCLALTGCFGKETPKQAPDLHQGGMIALPAPCGYTVTTHDGASRPEMSTAMFDTDPTPKFIHVNVANDPRTNMAILWRTNDNKTLATQVQFGTGGQTDQTADGFTFVYDVAGVDPLRMHETHLCGLKPDTEYSYRVTGGANTWSPVYTFRTAPDRTQSPDAEVVLLVLGDTRDGYDTWGAALKLANQMAPPDFILFSGDATNFGQVQDEWDAWFAAADPLLASIPMVVAHGNHEVNAVNFFSQFAMPGDEQNFAVEIGPIHLTVANDSPMNPADLQGQNAQLLGTNLVAGGAPWNLLMHHKPMWSACAGPHTADVTTMRDAWLATVDAHQVDLVFNGHDHDYERSKPLRNMTPGQTNKDGTIYVVVGAIGADLYDNGSDFWTAISEKTYSFAIARVRAGSITLNAYRPDGSMIDSTMLTK